MAVQLALVKLAGDVTPASLLRLCDDQTMRRIAGMRLVYLRLLLADVDALAASLPTDGASALTQRGIPAKAARQIVARLDLRKQ